MESLRISQLVSQARNCDAARTLAKARAFASQSRCAGGACAPATVVQTEQVPLESDYLAGKAGCYTYVNPVGCVPAGVYTLTLKECAETKFAATFKPYEAILTAPARCGEPNGPAVVYSQYYADAAGNLVAPHQLGGNISGNPPIPLMTVCPLPNKPDNPVLPG